MTGEPRVDELRASLDFVLEQVAALAGAPAERHLREAVRGAEAYGAAMAAQHLRNRLLAYLDGKAYHHQPQVGIKPRMRPEIADWIERLDGALLRHFTLPSARERRLDRGKRVLLLIDHLPPRDRMFSHTRQVCTYAAALALDPSVEAVLILSTQETAPENPFRASTELGVEHEMGWRLELEDLAGAPVPKVRFMTPRRVGPVRPYEESVARVREFDPDIVFSHLGIFRSRLLPLLLHPRAAMVGVQMNQINPEPEYSDLMLAHGYSSDFSDKPTPSKWRKHEVPIIPFPKEATVDPSDLGPASPLRIVTVLTLGRLETGLMRDEAAGLRFVTAFLEEHPRAVWLMVAIEDPDAFAGVIAPHLPPGVEGRLRLLPVVPDLRAIYEHCHIYVHLPPLSGGNMGIVMAIAEGVPVLAGRGTDGANTLHPDQAYRDSPHAAQILRLLAADPVLRSQWLARQRQKIEEDHSMRAASVTFHGFLAEALANFESRRARLAAGPGASGFDRLDPSPAGRALA